MPAVVETVAQQHVRITPEKLHSGVLPNFLSHHLLAMTIRALKISNESWRPMSLFLMKR